MLTNGPRYLRRASAAKYLEEVWGVPCSPRTLAKLACVSSDGPEMHYMGRFPLYTIEALDEYAQRRFAQPGALRQPARSRFHNIALNDKRRLAGAASSFILVKRFTAAAPSKHQPRVRGPSSPPFHRTR